MSGHHPVTARLVAPDLPTVAGEHEPQLPVHPDMGKIVTAARSHEHGERNRLRLCASVQGGTAATVP